MRDKLDRPEKTLNTYLDIRISRAKIHGLELTHSSVRDNDTRRPARCWNTLQARPLPLAKWAAAVYRRTHRYDADCALAACLQPLPTRQPGSIK